MELYTQAAGLVSEGDGTAKTLEFRLNLRTVNSAAQPLHKWYPGISLFESASLDWFRVNDNIRTMLIRIHDTV